MKAMLKTLGVVAVAGLVSVTAFGIRGGNSPLNKHQKNIRSDEVLPSGGTAVVGPSWNYTTGFEAADGFIARNPLFTYPPDVNGPSGWINDQPPGPNCPVGPDCWGVTGAADRSTREGHVDGVHAATGTQHLRLSHDPTTRVNIDPAVGVGIDARLPASADAIVRPTAPHTISMDLAIDSPFGQDFIIQPQNIKLLPVGNRGTQTLFYNTGGIYTVDDACGTLAGGAAYLPMSTLWDTTGGYHNFSINWDACTDFLTFDWDGAQVFPACLLDPVSGGLFCVGGRSHGLACLVNTDCLPTCMWTGAITTDQFLTYSYNNPGSSMDLDNLVIDMGDQCPAVCGNGILEPGEACDGVNADNACPDRCTPNCTCTPICTFDDPCPVENGLNGPYISSGGFYVYSGGSPFVSVNGCASSYDAAIQVQTVADPNTPIAFNDDCNDGPYGSGSDPSAPCYNGASGNQYGSCTCFANPGEPVLIWAPVFTGADPPVGSTSVISIRKKATCAGPSVGSCCDTNGADQGCTDNVTSDACVGADKVFTDQGKCADGPCDCIPDCTGRNCGDDGCGGSCGTCGDGNVCNGEETCDATGNCAPGTPLVCDDGNACNGVETCDPQGGCRPGTPLNCSDGLACNGTETCNPSSGCVPGAAPNCDDGRECTVDACNEPDGSCTNDDAGCAIPTVSEWGLVVLTLMLLIGAKVYFGRRQAIA